MVGMRPAAGYIMAKCVDAFDESDIAIPVKLESRRKGKITAPLSPAMMSLEASIFNSSAWACTH